MGRLLELRFPSHRINLCLYCVLTLMLAAVFVLVLSACGDDDVDEEVRVTLKELSITLETDILKPGRVRFVVVNEGSELHEFVIIKSPLAFDALPVADGKVDEARLDIVGRIDPFATGTTNRIAVDLEGGSLSAVQQYVLICNIVERVSDKPVESHYENGMRANILVSDRFPN